MILALGLIIALGFCLWFIERFVPMTDPFKILLRVIIAVVIVWIILSLFGVVPPPHFLHLGAALR